MPHLVILYTPQLDRDTDMGVLCRKLADAMIAQRDEAAKPCSRSAARACLRTPRRTSPSPTVARPRARGARARTARSPTSICAWAAAAARR